MRMDRKRITLMAAVCATVVIGLAVGAYAYDSTRDDLIVDGVTVAGVEVGGMRSSAAKGRLHTELAGRLERPVRLKAAGRLFRLTPERASLTADLDGMIDAALDRSRSGGLPGRVWRGITDSDVSAELPAEVNYSAVEVRRFVRRVKRTVDRPPRDAAVQFQTASLPAVPSETGLTMSYSRALRLVQGALSGIGSARTVRVDVRVREPKVTTDELARKYPEVVTIDRGGFTLRFFRRLKLEKSYRIAVGQAGLETPAGLYNIESKQVDPSWHVPNSDWAGSLAGQVIPPGPSNPLKARWMGIYAGAGIHGTADIGSLGTAASHGCIRMAVPDVVELYDKVPLGAPVYVQ
jgi:L,D-transpeptidase catalytic domain/Putative peptidoglycan binding domain